jgi:hypothetical protein
MYKLEYVIHEIMILVNEYLEHGINTGKGIELLTYKLVEIVDLGDLPIYFNTDIVKDLINIKYFVNLITETADTNIVKTLVKLSQRVDDISLVTIPLLMESLKTGSELSKQYAIVKLIKLASSCPANFQKIKYSGVIALLLDIDNQYSKMLIHVLTN